MGVSGPRIDRPSAIGDEGRSRATSLWLATVAVLALTTVVGVAIGEPSLALGLATVVGATVAGIGLLESDGRNAVELFVGHTLVMTFGSATALLVLVAPLVTTAGVAISGLTIAVLGIGASWANVGPDGLRRSAIGVLIVYASMILTLVVGGMVLVGAASGWRGIETLAGQPPPVLSFVGFVVVVSGTAAAVLVALRWLPLVQLTRRDRRPMVRRRLASLRRLLYGLVLATPIVLVVLTILGVSGWVSPDVSRESSVGSALAVFSSWLVLGPLLAIGVLSILSGGLALALEWGTRDRTTAAVRRTTAIAVGIALATVVLILWQLTPGFWLPVAVTTVVPIVPAIALACGVFAVWLGLLPARAGGPATAATGLVIAAIGLGWSRPVLVFACIASAVFVWDVSTFGLGVTGELGHLPETRRLELFHGVVAAGVAVVAVALAVGLETLRGVALVDGGSTGVTLVVLGAIVFLLPLRG